MILKTIDFVEGRVVITDQTALPAEERTIVLSSADEVAAAIRSMRVRGAPALGIAAAFGILLELENLLRESDPGRAGFFFDRKTGRSGSGGVAIDAEAAARRLDEAASLLAATRPTAVDLFRAIGRMRGVVRENLGDPALLCSETGAEAFSIYDNELETEKRIGSHGAALLRSGMSVLTHCNAGGLATAGYGTALAVIYSALELGIDIRVYADETRPLLQGGRLTAWELLKNGVDVTVLCDGAAASLIAAGRIGAAIVGADRIAANGDTANKIGTLGVAVLCAGYGVPFYVAAPLSTFDPDVPSGESIPIEHRPEDELVYFNGIRTIPEGARVYNPAFDVTPGGLVTAFITEQGVIYPPYGGKAWLHQGRDS